MTVHTELDDPYESADELILRDTGAVALVSSKDLDSTTDRIHPILDNMSLTGDSATWIDSTSRIGSITVCDRATLYIFQAGQVNNVSGYDRSALFLNAEVFDGHTAMTGHSQLYQGQGTTYNEIAPNEGFIIYHEMEGPDHSSEVKGCLQCRLAGEACLPKPNKFPPLRDSTCPRCANFDRFCAVSEAWSTGRSVAGQWLDDHHGTPTVVMVTLPQSKSNSSDKQAPPASFQREQGAKPATTGYDFIHERYSISNQLKLMFESWVGTKIIWWPLTEPLRYKDSRDVEIYTCGCGALIPREMSLPTAGNVQIPTVPQAVHATGPQTSNTATSTTSPPNKGISRKPGTNNKRNHAPQNSFRPPSAGKISNILQPGTGFFHACFNVRQQRSELFELDAKDMEEPEFLSTFLRTFYSALRFRSLWTMSECGGIHFVRFQRLSNHDNYVSITGSKLPHQTDLDYEFIRGPELKWLTDKVSHVLTRHACRSSLAMIPLVGRWLSSSKDCREHSIHQIPKRVPDRIESLEETAGYGMLAYSRPALWRIVLASILYLGLGASYMILRWVKDWDDMQTALAPITLLLAMWLGHLHLALSITERYDITPIAL